MTKHALKGNCARKGVQPAGHPWRKAVWYVATVRGTYKVDAARIEKRRKGE